MRVVPWEQTIHCLIYVKNADFTNRKLLDKIVKAAIIVKRSFFYNYLLPNSFKLLS